MKITYLQLVKIQLARDRKKSYQDVYDVVSVVSVLIDVDSLYLRRAVGSEWCPLIQPDAWKVISDVRSMLAAFFGQTRCRLLNLRDPCLYLCS